MKCTSKNIILLLPPENQKTEGGIFVPDGATADGSDLEYEVYMVGPDVTSVQEGDTVLRPETTVIASKRGRDYDLKVGHGGERRKAIVVDEDDIRVVIRAAAGIDADAPARDTRTPLQKKFDDAITAGSNIVAKVSVNGNTVEFRDGPSLLARFDKSEIKTIDISTGKQWVLNYGELEKWLAL